MNIAKQWIADMSREGSRQLVVLAGGLGSRLASQGIWTPKTLLPIGESSILEVMLGEAESEGFTKILFCLGNHSEQIINALSEINTPVEIEFSVERSPLGTLGALLYAKELLDSEFVLLMGDLLLARTNLKGFFDFSSTATVDLAILVKYTDHPWDSDLVEIDPSNRVTKIHKYPHSKIAIDSVAMAGGFYIKKSILDSSDPHKILDLTKSNSRLAQ
jgi:NDP-sugar pyrophosphorylase family protein